MENNIYCKKETNAKSKGSSIIGYLVGTLFGIMFLVMFVMYLMKETPETSTNPPTTTFSEKHLTPNSEFTKFTFDGKIGNRKMTISSPDSNLKYSIIFQNGRSGTYGHKGILKNLQEQDTYIWLKPDINTTTELSLK